jgi:hypothetical protein
VGLVTLDLGFNNIRPCVAASPFGSSCAAQGIAAVRQYLPVIVDDLKKAAGPRVHFVGLEYADPYLADYLLGSGGVLAANQNLGAMTQMNTALAQVYGAANVPVANVPGPFQSADAAPATMTGGRTVPTNVARACAWTWMCTKPPWGPDDHPNDAGYQVIANTIVTKLPRKW